MQGILGINKKKPVIHIQKSDDLIQIRRTVIRGQSPYFSIKKKDDTDFKRIHAHEIQTLVKDLNYKRL